MGHKIFGFKISRCFIVYDKFFLGEGGVKTNMQNDSMIALAKALAISYLKANACWPENLIFNYKINRKLKNSLGINLVGHVIKFCEV